MRCSKCQRRANALVSNPATPTKGLCEFCAPGSLEGATEKVFTDYKAGAKHKKGIEAILGPQRAHGQRVMTTDTFKQQQRPEVKRLA